MTTLEHYEGFETEARIYQQSLAAIEKLESEFEAALDRQVQKYKHESTNAANKHKAELQRLQTEHSDMVDKLRQTHVAQQSLRAQREKVRAENASLKDDAKGPAAAATASRVATTKMMSLTELAREVKRLEQLRSQGLEQAERATKDLRAAKWCQKVAKVSHRCIYDNDQTV